VLAYLKKFKDVLESVVFEDVSAAMMEDIELVCVELVE
jgi:hypothetical protein